MDENLLHFNSDGSPVPEVFGFINLNAVFVSKGLDTGTIRVFLGSLATPSLALCDLFFLLLLFALISFGIAVLDLIGEVWYVDDVE